MDEILSQSMELDFDILSKVTFNKDLLKFFKFGSTVEASDRVTCELRECLRVLKEILTRVDEERRVFRTLLIKKAKDKALLEKFLKDEEGSFVQSKVSLHEELMKATIDRRNSKIIELSNKLKSSANRDGLDMMKKVQEKYLNTIVSVKHQKDLGLKSKGKLNGAEKLGNVSTYNISQKNKMRSDSLASNPRQSYISKRNERSLNNQRLSNSIEYDSRSIPGLYNSIVGLTGNMSNDLIDEEFSAIYLQTESNFTPKTKINANKQLSEKNSIKKNLFTTEVSRTLGERANQRGSIISSTASSNKKSAAIIKKNKKN